MCAILKQHDVVLVEGCMDGTIRWMPLPKMVNALLGKADAVLAVCIARVCWRMKMGCGVRDQFVDADFNRTLPTPLIAFGVERRCCCQTRHRWRRILTSGQLPDRLKLSAIGFGRGRCW